MKLTESKLRNIVREELRKLNEASKNNLVWLDDVLVASLNYSEPVTYKVTKNRRSKDLVAGIGVDIGNQGMGILLGHNSSTPWVQDLIDEVKLNGRYSLDVRVAPALRLEGQNLVSMQPIVVDDIVSSPQPLVEAANSFRRKGKNKEFIQKHGKLYTQKYNIGRYADKPAAVNIQDETPPNKVANKLEEEFTVVEVLNRFSVVQIFPGPLNAERKIEDLLTGVNYKIEYSGAI